MAADCRARQLGLVWRLTAAREKKERALREMDGGALSIWLFTGERWGNPGMLYCAKKLGKDAGPLIASFKRILPVIETKKSGRQQKTIVEVMAKIEKAVVDYEEEYGTARP